MILHFDEILHIQDHDDPDHLIKAHFSCLLFLGRAGDGYKEARSGQVHFSSRIKRNQLQFHSQVVGMHHIQQYYLLHTPGEARVQNPPLPSTFPPSQLARLAAAAAAAQDLKFSSSSSKIKMYFAASSVISFSFQIDLI